MFVSFSCCLSRGCTRFTLRRLLSRKNDRNQSNRYFKINSTGEDSVFLFPIFPLEDNSSFWFLPKKKKKKQNNVRNYFKIGFPFSSNDFPLFWYFVNQCTRWHGIHLVLDSLRPCFLLNFENTCYAFPESAKSNLFFFFSRRVLPVRFSYFIYFFFSSSSRICILMHYHCETVVLFSQRNFAFFFFFFFFMKCFSKKQFFPRHLRKKEKKNGNDFKERKKIGVTTEQMFRLMNRILNFSVAGVIKKKKKKKCLPKINLGKLYYLSSFIELLL